MLKKRLFGLMAILAMLSFAACKTDDDSEDDLGYPARYEVVPGWTKKAVNTIEVTTNSAGRAAAGQSGNLQIVHAEHYRDYNHYIIYLGQINNMPIGNLTSAASYEGRTPATITRSQSDITVDTVGKSIATAVRETTFTTTVQNSEASVKSGINFLGFSIGAERKTKSTITNSTTIKDLSIENTETTATTKALAYSDNVSYTIGDHGEPVGRYRVVLFATADVYLYVKTDENHELAEGFTPEISVCTRATSYTYRIDYDPNLSGDFPRTGGGGMLPIPDDFSSLPELPQEPLFLAVGKYGSVVSSSDGIEWMETTVGGGARTWNGVAYGDNKENKIVMVGSYLNAGSTNMAYSYDATDWTLKIVNNDTTNWNMVTYVNGTWIATGKYGSTDVRMYSTNGEDWTLFNNSVVSQDFTFGFGRWVAVGNSGYITDATAFAGPWTSRRVGSANWNGVTYGNDKFVAVGNSGTTAYSRDGIGWTSQTVSTVVWNRVHYNGEKYVAVSPTVIGGFGRIAYSTDGINWTVVSVGNNAGWRDVTYGNGKWVAVGGTDNNNGRIAYSDDGTSWTEKPVGTQGSSNWNGVTFGIFY